MKIIFLDIDGVLVTGKYSREQYENKSWSRDRYGDGFDATAVAALTRILTATDAKIVVSSTWRDSGLPSLLEMWALRQLPGEVIGVTPRLSHRFRGLEINDWLSGRGFYHINHSSSIQQQYCQMSSIESYVILDDDSDMTLNQLHHFICTDPEYGLTEADADQAIERLNNGIKGWRPFRASEE